VKNVAVIETEVDPHSGAVAELTPAGIGLVTAELRREAVKNLPRMPILPVFGYICEKENVKMSSVKKKSDKKTAIGASRIDGSALFSRISKIIEKRKSRAGMYANREVSWSHFIGLIYRPKKILKEKSRRF
jgi:hypothetical protein